MPFVGLILSLIILAGRILVGKRMTGCGWAWLPGLERTPASQLLKAVGVGVLAALVVSWVFRDLRTGLLPALPEIWMGITFGPLTEEWSFRGALYHGLMLLLRRWLAPPLLAHAAYNAVLFGIAFLR